MARPRRPAPGLRSAARRSERVRRGVRRRTAGAPTKAYVGLTTRAAVLGLVLCALVVSAALPLREYLAQRGQLGQLEQSQAAQRVRIAALTQQKTMLGDPTYVASLARERLHFVKPGETTYLVLGAQDPAVTAQPEQAEHPAGPTAPWWSQLYGGVRTADRPVGR